MKLILLLLSCIAISAAESPPYMGDIDMFGMMDMTMRAGFEYMINMTKAYVLNEDGSDWNPAVQGMFTMGDSQLCPMESKQCVPEENWMFGCKCRKGFRELGKCKSKPCQLFKHFRDNGVDSLNRFINAESYEEWYSIIVNDFINPISRALCECPKMIGAAMNCVQKYDGSLFEMMEADRSGFDAMVGAIDWKTIKAILNGFVDAGCGEKNGKDCVMEMSKMYVLMGTFMDNTFNGDEGCLSLVRMEEEFIEYIMTMGSFDWENASIKTIATQFVDAHIKLEKEVMCEPTCAEEMRDSFYSCCTKHAMEVLSSKPMRKKYIKLFQNIYPLVAETADAKVPDLSKAIKKYLSMFDVASFCKDQTNVYMEKNKQCDALEA